MKVGIVGDAKRAVAWEKHLRPHQIVREVDLVPELKDVGDVQACIILDDTPDNLGILHQGIKRGLNCFLVSKAPTDKTALEKIQLAAKEAGVKVQFSLWPVLAPATQWMMNKIPKPTTISINREVNFSQLVNPKLEFEHYWIDELGFCLKWINTGVHHVEANSITFSDKPLFIHFFLRFDNGATADVSVYTGASQNRHQRLACNHQHVLECTVPDQQVRLGHLNSGSFLYFEKEQFDPSKAAEKAALLFLKAVQMNTEPVFNSYDAYQLALHVDKIRQKIS